MTARQPTDLFERAQPNMAGYRDLSVEALAAHTCDARLIDVREPSELDGELGHIAGIEPVPLATLESACTTWDPTTPIVVICRSGARSARAADALSRRGFQKVMNLVGGMLAWNQRELPVERGPR